MDLITGLPTTCEAHHPCRGTACSKMITAGPNSARQSLDLAWQDIVISNVFRYLDYHASSQTETPAQPATGEPSHGWHR